MSSVGQDKIKKKRKNGRGKSKKDSKVIDVEDIDSDEDNIINTLPLHSVVKVFASLTSPDYERPWQMLAPFDVSGSGFACQNQRIITNAHVVEDATFVAVRKYGFTDKIPVHVVCISYDCDLAILEVTDPESAELFWKDLKPLALTPTVPHLQDEVLVAGYPVGGDNISVTKGIVSRIEPIEYTESDAELLAVQIDAAVNSGNSGGPCFKDNKVVGVAFQGLDDADGISYIIPMTIVNHFLTEFEEKGSFGGFCSLGLEVQFMENSQLRKAYKMPKGTSGILVRYINMLSPAFGKILPGDILLSIDGVKIANDGSVRFRKHELINYTHLITQKFPGTSCHISLLRSGKPFEIDVILMPVPDLIPATRAAPALYVCWAGLVFVPVSLPFLTECYGEDMEDAPSSLSAEVTRAKRSFPDQQLIVLASVLVDEINYGYEDESGRLLQRVNGTQIINLKHLLDILAGLQTGVVTMEFDEQVVLVFDAEEVNKKNFKIMLTHKIPSNTNILSDGHPIRTATTTTTTSTKTK